MTHPHKTKLTDKHILRIHSMEFTESPLGEFWEAVESLPDNLDGKNYKKIIKKLFNKDGESKFVDYDDLVKVLEKQGEHKDQEAFQEWHDTMGIIRRKVSHQIHMNRLRKDRDDRKQEIKDRTRVDKLRAERRANNRESEYQAD